MTETASPISSRRNGGDSVSGVVSRATRRNRAATPRPGSSRESGACGRVMRTASRRQPLDDPLVAVATELQPVVQPVGAALPELHGVGHEPESAPEVGHRDVLAEALLELRSPAYQ